MEQHQAVSKFWINNILVRSVQEVNFTTITFYCLQRFCWGVRSSQWDALRDYMSCQDHEIDQERTQQWEEERKFKRTRTRTFQALSWKSQTCHAENRAMWTEIPVESHTWHAWQTLIPISFLLLQEDLQATARRHFSTRLGQNIPILPQIRPLLCMVAKPFKVLSCLDSCPELSQPLLRHWDRMPLTTTFFKKVFWMKL
jgi:hypothetical protein